MAITVTHAKVTSIPDDTTDHPDVINPSDWNAEHIVIGSAGDDLDTTPVAPTGSTLARTMPEWLAGAPVIEWPDAEILISEDHLGCWIHMMNDIGSLVMLPDDWPPGWSFGVRQQGLGIVLWQYVGGSTVQLPFSKSDHTGLAEQYEEAVFRVLSNSDGHSAVWGISGGTF